LNRILRDEDRTVAWYDTKYSRLANAAEIAAAVQSVLLRPLVERNRWAETGALMQDPLVWIRKILPTPMNGPTLPVALTKDLEDRAEALGQRGRCTFAPIFVRALLAANRRDDARAVAEHCRSVDPSSEMNAVLTALGMTLPS
jgi:hypothetical protein